MSLSKLASIVLIGFILFFSGCSPAFKAGDCFQYGDNPCEKWETTGKCNVFVDLVLEVGQYKYRTLFTNIGKIDGNVYVLPQDGSIRFADRYAHKVKCPKILQEKYNEFKSQSN